jgi:hypothetical protein
MTVEMSDWLSGRSLLRLMEHRALSCTAPLVYVRSTGLQMSGNACQETREATLEQSNRLKKDHIGNEIEVAKTKQENGPMMGLKVTRFNTNYSVKRL